MNSPSEEFIRFDYLQTGGQPWRASRFARNDAPPVGRLAHGLRPAYTSRVNTLMAEARRRALSKGHRPASKGTCVVYFLRLHSGALYIGVSEDLEQRLEDHSSGQACRTTRLDPPVSFLRFESFETLSEARLREAQLKRWSRAKKEALLSGDLERLHVLSKSRESANLRDAQNASPGP